MTKTVRLEKRIDSWDDLQGLGLKTAVGRKYKNYGVEKVIKLAGEIEAERLAVLGVVRKEP